MRRSGRVSKSSTLAFAAAAKKGGKGEPAGWTLDAGRAQQGGGHRRVRPQPGKQLEALLYHVDVVRYAAGRRPEKGGKSRVPGPEFSMLTSVRERGRRKAPRQGSATRLVCRGVQREATGRKHRPRCLSCG